MPTRLFVIDKEIENLPDNADYILNLSQYNIDDKREVNYREAFREILKETKKTYLEFIYQFGQKSGFLNRKIPGASLWWFSEIQHKDSWGDDFLRDIAIINLIQFVQKQIKIDFTEFHTDSPLIRSYAELKTPGNTLFAFKCFLSRTKLFLKSLIIKLIYRKESPNFNVDHLFLSYLPTLWQTFNKTLIERNFKKEPYKIQGGVFAIYVEKINAYTLNRKIPEKSIIIQSYIGVGSLLRHYLNFGHFVWFLREKQKLKSLCRYNNINLWPVYEKYIYQTVLLNDFSYASLIEGLRNAVDTLTPKNFIAPGEFAFEGKAIAVACMETETRSVWYQHTPFTTDKFWLLNHQDEVDNYNRNDRGNICRGENTEFMPFPNKTFVWSEYYKNFTQKYSLYPGNRINVVGSIKFSEFKRISGSTKINIGQNKKYFFTTTVSETEVRLFCYFINELCKDGILEKEQIIFKLHPNSDKFFNIESILSEYRDIRDINVISKTAGLESYVETIKCIIAGGTTVGIEAAYFGVPVVQYIPKYGLNLSALDEHTATCFSDVSSLKKILANLDKLKPIDCRLFFVEPDLSHELLLKAIA